MSRRRFFTRSNDGGTGLIKGCAHARVIEDDVSPGVGRPQDDGALSLRRWSEERLFGMENLRGFSFGTP
jgi:hypothetical protein